MVQGPPSQFPTDRASARLSEKVEKQAEGFLTAEERVGALFCQLMKSMLTSTNWYIALNRAFSSANSQHHIDMQTRELNQYETCPPCDSLFLKLENTGQRGKMSQVVRVQERGEPKSGTGMMFDWATASLLRTCEYLQDNFGEETEVCYSTFCTYLPVLSQPVPGTSQ